MGWHRHVRAVLTCRAPDGPLFCRRFASGRFNPVSTVDHARPLVPRGLRVFSLSTPARPSAHRLPRVGREKVGRPCVEAPTARAPGGPIGVPNFPPGPPVVAIEPKGAPVSKRRTRGGSRGTSEPSMIDCRHRVKAPGGERAAKKELGGCPTRKNGSHVTVPTRKNGSHVTAPPRKNRSHVTAPPPKNRSHVRVGRQQVGCPLAAGWVKTSPPGGGRCVPTRNNGEEVGGAGRPTRPRLSREHTWRHSTATDTPQPPGPV